MDSQSLLTKVPLQRFKVGMRITVFKEGAPFIHPVTKEPLGNVQAQVGTVDVISVDASSAKGTAITGKPEDFQGAKVKIPARKIRLLFYQGNIDWYLGDAYYHSLLDSGRFELIDTALLNATPAEVIAEAKAKGAEVALILNSEEEKTNVEVAQKLYWVTDGKQFSETKTSIHVAMVKQLKFSSGYLPPAKAKPSCHIKCLSAHDDSPLAILTATAIPKSCWLRETTLECISRTLI